MRSSSTDRWLMVQRLPAVTPRRSIWGKQTLNTIPKGLESDLLLEVVVVHLHSELIFLHNFAEVSEFVRSNEDLNLNSDSRNVIPEAVLKALNKVMNLTDFKQAYGVAGLTELLQNLQLHFVFDCDAVNPIIVEASSLS